MNAADAAVARTVRREFCRRPVESARVEVQVINGYVTLTGILMRLRDQQDVNLQTEMDIITKQIKRDRGVKDVSTQMRLMEVQDQKKEEAEPRGRLRR